MFTLSGFNLLRLADISSPALLNSRSDGTDIAVRNKYTLATFCCNEKTCLFLLHHRRGSSFLLMTGTFRYCSTSVSAEIFVDRRDTDCAACSSKTSHIEPELPLATGSSRSVVGVVSGESALVSLSCHYIN